MEGSVLSSSSCDYPKVPQLYRTILSERNPMTNGILTSDKPVQISNKKWCKNATHMLKPQTSFWHHTIRGIPLGSPESHRISNKF